MLGAGFLEKVCENALVHELRKRDLAGAQQCAVSVRYDGKIVGTYVADLVVADIIMIELKVGRVLDDGHRAQCINYLKATDLRLCLLLNFGKPRLEVRRIVHGYQVRGAAAGRGADNPESARPPE
ncbi:MAG: GxxExxY protein [Acetobacteraceae bacterium]|nr:GxxExxY protein [Acetobacteraceae bacterium]